ncbi:hypothetical protein [uncultured Gilliamella sp.]|uniref:hypothetical protein n=1 Tax=uncultured Gilliamella sp. TaxID=1193505 RepID=UPI0025E0BA9A|nr:hypothetical protein [uncultured Gilliamella sp.]
MTEHNKTYVLLDKNNKEDYTSTVTDDIWLYDINEQNIRNNFAEPTHKNSVKGYVQSYEYFQDLITEIRSAEKEIYITGWQVNWDAKLTPDLRLIDVLLEVVQKSKNLQIFILPWRHQYPMNTGDHETMIVLRNYINEYIGREAIAVRSHESLNDESSPVTTRFYSHHQKSIIIDKKIAFVGGIDLAYGRYSHGYDLDPKADNRQVLNRYNPCVVLMGDAKKKLSLTFDPTDRSFSSLKLYKHLQDQVFIKKLAQPTKVTLADNQPIMPWQDIHVKIEGKAVFDLAINFILRWNQAENKNEHSKNVTYNNRSQNWPPTNQDVNFPPENVSDECLHRKIPLPTQENYDDISDTGNISVQILRSASKSMRVNEAQVVLHDAVNDILSGKEGVKNRPPNVENNVKFTNQPQSDIYQVMLKLIKKAKRYIYIENQFFISDYGQPFAGLSKLSKPAETENGLTPFLTRLLSFSGDELPENQIVQALSDKIANVIFAYQPQPFHIYITIPVHPEGMLSEGAIITQTHHTRQTISFGTDSLLNRIRKHLWVYQQLNNDKVPRKQWNKLRPTYYDKIGDEYKTVPLEECAKYVTLLNLRSWTQLGDRSVTEQIYVHSKLTIVDDLYVLVGSANINDRSLLGDRDSELAALIVDNDAQTIQCPERGIEIPVRKFAYQLRKKICQGLYGEGLEQAIEVPELASSVKAIQSRAKANTDIFESIFPFIPRNYFKTEYNKDLRTIFASIWPALDYDELEKNNDEKWQEIKASTEKNKGQYPKYESVPIDDIEELAKDNMAYYYFKHELLMPFNTVFWQNYTINQPSELQKVKGCITLVPIHWTEGENNAIPYHIRLVT